MIDKKVKKIEKVISQIRPALQAHGGGIEFVEFTESGTVKIRLQGHCVGCPMASITLRQGVERTLLEQLPGLVVKVEEV